ncbi:MAG: hypothetical protein GY716_09270 [bacterium]|nr:hypothetical protein [bacterium]
MLNKRGRLNPHSVSIAVLILLCVLIPSAHAEEGRIPIFEPVVLTSGGKYIVTRDISSSFNIIQVNGTGTEVVEIDLNGFTLTLGPEPTGTAIQVQNVKTFVLRNGSVVCADPFHYGIDVQTTSADGGAVIEDVKVRGGLFGIWLHTAANIALRRNFITESNIGALIQGSVGGNGVQGTIEDNVLRDTTTGINFNGVSFNTNGLVIRSNNLLDVGTGVFADKARRLIVADNDIGATNMGIHVLSTRTCTIANNRISGDPSGSSEGIDLGDVHGCVVTDNVADNHGSDGIVLLGSTGNLIVGNIVHDNAGAGIRITNGSERNTVERNVATYNGAFGIHFTATGSDTHYGRNSTQGNSGPSCAVAAGAVCVTPPDLCDEGSGNVSFGDNLAPGPC